MPIDFSRIDQIINQLRYVRSGDIVLSSYHNSQNDAIKELTDLLKNHPRPPAMIIAASDTPETLKQKADYICDGVSDQVEINEALTKSSTVILCEGTYQINDSIVMQNNTRLIGSNNTTIKTDRDESFDFIKVVGKTNVEVRNIRLYLPFTPSADVIIRAIYIENSTNILIESCKIIGYFYWGVCTASETGWCQNIKVIKNYFEGTGGDICVEFCRGASILENTLYNCDFYSIRVRTSSALVMNNVINNSAGGVEILSFLDEWFEGQCAIVSNNIITSSLADAVDAFETPIVVITDNYAEIAPDIWTLAAIEVYDVDRAIIANNVIDGKWSAYYGIYLDYYNYTAVQCIIEQNTINNVGGAGILGWMQNSIISGNIISYCRYEGIYIIADNTIISKNTIHTTSQIGNNQRDCIYADYSKNLIIEGNRCYWGNETNKPRYGIYIDSGCQRIMIHGNNLYQSGVTGDLYIASGTNTKARDNIGNNGEWLSDI